MPCEAGSLANVVAVGNDRAASKYVNLVVPPVLFGGNSKGLLDWMKLRSQPVAGRLGVWRVCTEENYLNRPRPGLLLYRQLAGPGAVDCITQVLGAPVGGTAVEAGPEAIERVNTLGSQLRDRADRGVSVTQDRHEPR